MGEGQGVVGSRGGWKSRGGRGLGVGSQGGGGGLGVGGVKGWWGSGVVGV